MEVPQQTSNLTKAEQNHFHLLISLQNIDTCPVSVQSFCLSDLHTILVYWALFPYLFFSLELRHIFQKKLWLENNEIVTSSPGSL